MSKSKLMRSVLIIGSILIIVGVALMMWLLATEDERNNVIKISLDAGDSKPIEFEALCLLPGDECEYEVELIKGTTSTFYIDFNFVETGEGTLKDYARVKVISAGNTLYDALLADAIDRENILFPVDFDKDQNTKFKVVYYLPIDVGNEAKNAEANFELILTASKE